MKTGDLVVFNECISYRGEPLYKWRNIGVVTRVLRHQHKGGLAVADVRWNCGWEDTWTENNLKVISSASR